MGNSEMAKTGFFLQVKCHSFNAMTVCWISDWKSIQPMKNVSLFTEKLSPSTSGKERLMGNWPTWFTGKTNIKTDDSWVPFLVSNQQCRSTKAVVTNKMINNEN